MVYIYIYIYINYIWILNFNAIHNRAITWNKHILPNGIEGVYHYCFLIFLKDKKIHNYGFLIRSHHIWKQQPRCTKYSPENSSGVSGNPILVQVVSQEEGEYTSDEMADLAGLDTSIVQTFYMLQGPTNILKWIINKSFGVGTYHHILVIGQSRDYFFLSTKLFLQWHKLT